MPGSEPLYRVFGTIVGLGLAVVTAIWEVMLSPMMIGGTRIPVATLVAIVANISIVYFTRFVTGRVGLALVPALGWFGVILAATTRTSEGDLLIPADNWVGVTTLLFGSVAWAVAAYRLILKRPVTPAPAAPPAAKKDARSGR